MKCIVSLLKWVCWIWYLQRCETWCSDSRYFHPCHTVQISYKCNPQSDSHIVRNYFDDQTKGGKSFWEVLALFSHIFIIFATGFMVILNNSSFFKILSSNLTQYLKFNLFSILSTCYTLPWSYIWPTPKVYIWVSKCILAKMYPQFCSHFECSLKHNQ